VRNADVTELDCFVYGEEVKKCQWKGSGGKWLSR